MPIGKSNEHQAFPGTLTLSAETLIRLWTEIGESVARAGIRRLVIANSHGGQPQIMDIVARDLRVRLGMLVVTMSYGALGRPPGLFPESERRHGIHGGSSETSMMLHLRPDLVRNGERRNFAPSPSRWNASGCICGPRAASALAGRRKTSIPKAPAATRSTPMPSGAAC
jgi:creatinine amidohydrolase